MQYRSAASFVTPYGEIGSVGVDSDVGSCRLVPYTEVGDEKTTRPALSSRAARRTVGGPPTVTPVGRGGSRHDPRGDPDPRAPRRQHEPDRRPGAEGDPGRTTEDRHEQHEADDPEVGEELHIEVLDAIRPVRCRECERGLVRVLPPRGR